MRTRTQYLLLILCFQEVDELRQKITSGQTDDEYIIEMKARHFVELQNLEQTISAKYQEEYIAQLGAAIIEKDGEHQV